MARPPSDPDYAYEAALPAPVCGIDEAGRGPWAGPVVAAAVILRPGEIPPGLADSKVLAPARRRALFTDLAKVAEIGVGRAEVAEIDRLNILGATMLAMRRAVAALPRPPAAALVDGNRPPDLSCRVECLVKGDARSLSIAAASIVAKVSRDALMADLAAEFGGYGWERNMGYGTAEHRDGLARLGVTVHHRRSFAPIKRLLDSAVSN
ncbi:MAG: ribonuclease HII [Alphaproteobacteria bacterium]|jgi:ribonuclease HII|nr:ribonuclease HII [Alphaproteobacteria bacterium]MDP6566407.1 ribonuclease HII [Alphaproteobacteria bacterium]MDP6811635.1 ribonuclease HII [Alphaproteobacteria bacterium]